MGQTNVTVTHRSSAVTIAAPRAAGLGSAIAVTPTGTTGTSVFAWSKFNEPLTGSETVHPDSTAMVNNLITQATLHQGWQVGYRATSTPVYFATGSEPLTTFTMRASWCVGRTITVPWNEAAWQKSTGSDKHVAVVYPNGCEVDIWGKEWNSGQPLTIGQAQTVRQFVTDGFLPSGLGCRSGNMALTGGLAMKSEIISGYIPHALTFPCDNSTVRSLTSGGNVRTVAPCPMSGAIQVNPSGRIPEGARLRLSPTIDIDDHARNTSERAILRALQEYGAYMVDGGGWTFYAEDVKSSGGYPDWSADSDEWSLPPALLTTTALQVLQWPGDVRLKASGSFNGAETCPGYPVV